MPIRWAKFRPGQPPLVDGELLAEGQVLESELAMAAEKERGKPQHVKYEDDHEPRFWPS